MRGLQTRLLPSGHPRFRSPEVHNNVGALDALHRAVDQFADPLAVLRVDGVTLGFADFLENDLLGRLRGDPAEHVRGLGNLDLAVQVHLRIEFTPLFQADFMVGVLNLLHHLLARDHPHGPRFLVEVRFELFGRLVVFPSRHKDGIFYGLDDHLRVNALLAAHLIDGLVKETRRHSVNPLDSVGIKTATPRIQPLSVRCAPFNLPIIASFRRVFFNFSCSSMNC